LVFTEDARRLVLARQVADEARVSVVPFGVPTVLRRSEDLPAPQMRPAVNETLSAMDSRRVLSTFGLIAPGKGLEAAIGALPAMVTRRPDVLYVIAGATHPDVVRRDGEAYRDHLRELVDMLELDPFVLFLDAYLTPVELAAILGRTDIYLAPRLCTDRTFSGSLTYAVAAGCATVAGAHPYSAELLADGAGVIIPPADSAAITDAVLRLFDDPRGLLGARRAAAATGRRFTWPAVARRVGALLGVDGAATVGPQVPEVRLDHLSVDADDGPTAGATEGRARAAVVASGLLELQPEVLPPAGWTTAAGWVGTALERLGRDPLTGADDPGWARWGLCAVADGPGVPEPLREQARALRDRFAEVAPGGLDGTALTVLGLAVDPDPGPVARSELGLAAGRLSAAWQSTAWRGAAWPWFTDNLGGGGARLPQALIAAGRRLQDDTMIRRGLEALDWYGRRAGLSVADGVLRPPTARPAGAPLDAPHLELAVDAGATAEAFAEAYRATGSAHHGRLARKALDWFLGANRHGEPVYCPATGTCAEGVGLAGVVERHSAAATLAYLGALLALASTDLVTVPVVRPQHSDLAVVA
jgi:hypothetical protein